MITALLFFWLFMVLAIAAYRRSRGLDDSSVQNSWWQQMDEQELERLEKQGYDEAERSRRLMDESSEDYERQRNHEMFS